MNSKRIIDLWGKITDGDRSAWRELVRALAPLVFTVAQRAGLTREDANDCAQQTWMDLYRGRDGIKDPERLPAWLIRVASRKAARIVRKKMRDDRIKRDPALPSWEESYEEQVVILERYALLMQALESLDRRCRSILEQIFFADQSKTYEEIARDLDMAANSLGPTRTRCLRKLKEILLRCGYE